MGAQQGTFVCTYITSSNKVRALLKLSKGEKVMLYSKTIVFLVMIVPMILSACQSTLSSAPEEPVATKAQVTTEVPAIRQTPAVVDFSCSPNCQYSDLVVGFVQTGSEGGWRTANTISFKETAEQLGITLKFHDSQNDPAKQIAGFKQFILDPEVNVIVLAAIETNGWEDVLQEAKDAGKVVVIEDRRIDSPESLYATYIGSDFVLEGRKAAEEMCKLLEGSAGKKVWELVGNVGSSAAIDRGKGFREGMGACGIEIVNSQTANWSLIEGLQVTEAWLREGGDVQGVFAQNDEMGFGAIQALKDAGFEPGAGVKIITVDATAGAFQAMLEGTLNVAIECNPLLAPQVYEAALKSINGEKLPKWIPSQEGVFRADDPALQEIVNGRTY
jgi:galactofuranose transport system substrate-binding protein